MSDAKTALHLVWGMPDASCGPRDDGSTREACAEYSETGDRCECPCRRDAEPIAAAIESARREIAQRCAEIALRQAEFDAALTGADPGQRFVAVRTAKDIADAIKKEFGL